jgi:predicted RNase H-like nuclease (RuvC/YqgF family)
MRKLVLSVVAAGAALAAATPAAAQYYPQGSGYGSGYNGYGQNNYRGGGSLQARINGVQRQIENLRARRMISRDEAEGLRHESRELERRLYRLGNYGLNGREAQDIQYRIARLEQHVQHEVRDGRGWNRY